MITYDKYYQTPRIWLIGYDEARPTVFPFYYPLTSIAESHTTDPFSNLSGRVRRSCPQNRHDRSFPPFCISPGRFGPSLQTCQCHEKGH